MTKKDFEFIAKIIAGLPKQSKMDAAVAFSKALSTAYPRFDVSKFILACTGMK